MKMDLFGASSGFVVLGFCFVLMSFSFFLIGFAAPYWVRFTAKGSFTYTFGLWKQCTETPSSTVCEGIKDPTDWFQFVQVSSCVALTALMLTILLLLLFIFFLKKRESVLLSSIGSIFIADLFTCLSVIIFGAKVDEGQFLGYIALTDSFHVSFAFFIISMILSTLAGIFLIIETASRHTVNK